MIGIASGRRTEAVRAVGAFRAIDRCREDVRALVHEFTGGRGAAAVFDPVGATTSETSLALLAPRGCLVNYGQLGGALPAVDLAQLMEADSIFVTKYGPRAAVVAIEELAPVISSALLRARTQPLSAGVAACYPLDSVVDAFRTMEAGVGQGSRASWARPESIPSGAGAPRLRTASSAEEVRATDRIRGRCVRARHAGGEDAMKVNTQR